MSSPTEMVVETRSVPVQSRTIEIVCLTWPDGGVLYDVFYGEDCLTMEESLDHIPDDDEVRELIEGADPLFGMEEWARELIKALDLCFAPWAILPNGSTMWACMDDCCSCLYIIDDTDYLDRYSLSTEDGPSCPSRQECACHSLPPRRPGFDEENGLDELAPKGPA